MRSMTAPFLVSIMCLTASAYSAGCSGGPGCPMCTGRVSADSADERPILSPGQGTLFNLIAPNTEEKGITAYRFGLTNRLEGGVAYAWSDNRPLGSLKYLAQPERADRPALMLGIGSRRTGGSDSSAFLSGTKGFSIGKQTVRLNLGLAYVLRQSVEQCSMEDMDPMDPMDPMAEDGSVDNRKAFMIGGMGFPLGRSAAGAFQYDGRSVHAMCAARAGSLNLGIMLLKMEDPAFSVSYSLK